MDEEEEPEIGEISNPSNHQCSISDGERLKDCTTIALICMLVDQHASEGWGIPPLQMNAEYEHVEWEGQSRAITHYETFDIPFFTKKNSNRSFSLLLLFSFFSVNEPCQNHSSGLLGCHRRRANCGEVHAARWTEPTREITCMYSQPLNRNGCLKPQAKRTVPHLPLAAIYRVFSLCHNFRCV